MASDAAHSVIRCVVRPMGNDFLPDDRSGCKPRRMAPDLPAVSDWDCPRCGSGQFSGAGSADCDLYVAKRKGKMV